MSLTAMHLREKLLLGGVGFAGGRANRDVAGLCWPWLFFLVWPTYLVQTRASSVLTTI